MFLEFFMEGLKEDIRYTVKMLDPFTLSQDVEKAKYQEKVIEAWDKKGKATWGKSSYTNQSASPSNQRSSTNHKGEGSNNFGNQNTRVNKYMRNQRLHYKCGDKYFPGHQCKEKQNNAITAEEHEEEIQ